MVVVGVALRSGIANALVRRVSPTRNRRFKRDDVFQRRPGLLDLPVRGVDKGRAKGHDQLQREQQQSRKQSDLRVTRGWGR